MRQRVTRLLLSVLCCFLFAACNQDMMPDGDVLRTSANAGTVYMQDFIPDRNAAVGTEVMLTDKRDNAVYRCIKMADGRWWMGENLKYNVAGSVSYNNETASLETYGRLYKWQEAVDAVPENWNLPGDDEWKALEIALGMTQADADVATAWRNSGNVGTQLKANGSSGMNLLLGGYQHTGGSYLNLGIYGRYWTSTESSATAFDRDVYSNKVGVYRGTFSKAYRYSVRCVLQIKETVQYMQDFTPVGDEPIGTEVMLTDKRDNTVYRCIKMADGRWWMGENLRYDIEGSVVYNNEATNLETYGRLYDWATNKDYVPEGWSLPYNAEWIALGKALGGNHVAGGKMKSTTPDWLFPNKGATNESGWNGFPGGQYYIDRYTNIGAFGCWWQAELGMWSLSYNGTYLSNGTYSMSHRFSVRCILKETKRSLYMQDFVPFASDTVGTEVMLADKRDGIVYRCIKMADGKWWMGENLRGRFGTFVEGQPTETYGLLYDWAASKDYVPEGWKLPNNSEWDALGKALGESSGGKMKSTTPDWLSPNKGATNESGWNGFPGGWYDINYGGYNDKGVFGYWWSADVYTPWVLYRSSAYLAPSTSEKSMRASIRCVLKE